MWNVNLIKHQNIFSHCAPERISLLWVVSAAAAHERHRIIQIWNTGCLCKRTNNKITKKQVALDPALVACLIKIGWHFCIKWRIKRCIEAFAALPNGFGESLAKHFAARRGLATNLKSPLETVGGLKLWPPICRKKNTNKWKNLTGPQWKWWQAFANHLLRIFPLTFKINQ